MAGRPTRSPRVSPGLTAPAPARALVAAALAGTLLVGCGAVVGESPGNSVIVIGSGGLVGQPAPPFRLADLAGATVSLSDYAGRPVIVNFWASWCIPCQQEFPMYRQARDEFESRGLEVLGIIHDDASDAARAFMTRHGGDWPALLDPGDAVASAYRVVGIPTSFFVDRHGTIRDVSYGPPPADALAAYVQQILQ